MCGDGSLLPGPIPGAQLTLFGAVVLRFGFGHDSNYKSDSVIKGCEHG